MKDRHSAIEVIKALLAKTQENGCTEAEYLAALDKARALMDSWEISNDELAEAKELAAILFEEPSDEADPHQLKWNLTYGVRLFCGVQIYRHGSESGLKYIGAPSDVELARFLLDSLANFVHNELFEHLLGCLAPKGERQIIIRSFRDAACSRINARLGELVQRSKAAQTSSGKELVVIKGAAVKAFMKEHDIHLRSCGGSAPRHVNEAAQAAGRAAGDRASFGRPVSGPAGAARIGRQ
jgi:Protein of unknown function (DUF2786)